MRSTSLASDQQAVPYHAGMRELQDRFDTRRLADRLDKLSQQGHVAKGRSLYVEGRLEPREYTANDGTQRVSYDVTMTDFNFVGGDRPQGEQGGGGSYQSNQSSGGNGGGQRRSTYDDAPPADNFDDVPF